MMTCEATLMQRSSPNSCLCRTQAAQAAETNPELKQLMKSLEQENESLRDKVQNMGHILKANQQTVGAYIANSQQVLQRAGMADKQRTRSRSPR